MKLIYQKTKQEVKIGSMVQLPDRSIGRVIKLIEPTQSSDGRIVVERSYESEYYTSVIDGEWIEGEGQQ